MSNRNSSSPLARRIRRALVPGRPEFPDKRQVEVLGRRMAYLDAGSGPPVLFVHGGIGSSHLWRRSIRHVSQHARCIAVDLIGTGDSERILPSGRGAYQTADHVTYLDAFTAILGIDRDLTLVTHGWGSMVAFDWARRHPSAVRAICHMESVVRPLSWVDLTPEVARLLETVRSSDGEMFVLQSDDYFRAATDLQVLHPLRPEILAEYRRTFGTSPESRRAVLTGLREIPIDGEPEESSLLVERYWTWLGGTTIPKLLIHGEPGYLMVGRNLEAALQLPEQRVLPVAGAHLLPEDSPDGVGAFLARWHRGL
jgi:haloalkane dehalogenase